VGRTLFVESVTITLDNAAVAQVSVNPDTGSRFPGWFAQVMVSAGQPVTIPVNQIMRPFMFQNGYFNLAVRNNLTGGSVNYRGSIAVSGFVLTDDLNFSADYTMLVAGDSISASTGPTATAKMYHHLVKQRLIGAGYNTRIVAKAVSGSTSSEHETWRKAGFHDALGRVGIGMYCLGTNDGLTGVSPATVVANALAYQQRFRAKWPKAPLIVVTPPPNNSGFETQMAAIRAALVTAVAGWGDAKTIVADIGAAWTATDATKYTDNVHPNDAGHALIDPIIWAAMQAGGALPSNG